MSLIKLDRVEFIHAINVPGQEVGQYPSREKYLVGSDNDNPNRRLSSSSKHFKISLDEARGVVLVEHPKNPDSCVRVPLTNVESWAEAVVPAEKSAAKK